MAPRFKSETDRKAKAIRDELSQIPSLIVDLEQITSDVVEKLYGTMSSMREYEAALYEDESSPKILEAQLLWMKKQFSESESLNEEIRKKYSQNISAKILAIEHALRNKKHVEADRLVKDLKVFVAESPTPQRDYELGVHKANSAYFYYHIGPKYYVKAIELYKEAIATLEVMQQDSPQNTSPDKDPIFKLLCIWRYKLVHLYNRMLNAGNIKTYDESGTMHNLDVFHKMCELVHKIRTADNQYPVYLGRSYIDMLTAHEKLRGDKNDETPFFIERALGRLTEVKGHETLLISMAIEQAQNDGTIMEKIGSYYRKRATNVEEFTEAENVLLRCVHLYPNRHVALHQLSHVYRSMWILINNFEEAWLYNNERRTGLSNTRGRGRGRGRDRGIGRTRNMQSYSSLSAPEAAHQSADLGASGGAFCSKHQNPRSDYQAPCQFLEDTDDGYDSLLSQIQQMSISNAPRHMESNIDQDGSRGFKFDPNRIPKANYVQPRKHTQWGQKPAQFRKPDYANELRSRNPVKTDSTKANNLLRRAIDVLKKANEEVKGTACRYLLDLARLHICNGSPREEVDECFNKAMELSSSISYSEYAFLFEQYALFRDRGEASGEDLEEIKRFYKDSVSASVGACEVSKIAFYRYKDILESQKTDEPNNKSYDMECTLLQKLVENFTYARRKLGEILKDDPNNIKTLWNLVDIQFKTGHFLDAYSNMKMILTLQSPDEFKNQFQTYRDDDESPIIVSNPIDVAIKAVESIGSLENFKSREIILSCFRELTKADPKDKDFFVMKSDSDDESVEKLRSVMTGMKFELLDLESNPEEFFGHGFNNIYEDDTHKRARCFLVLVDTLSEEETPNEMQVINAIVGDASVRPILLYSGEELGELWQKKPKFQHCPNVSYACLLTEDTDDSKMRFISDLLIAVFQNIAIEP